MIGVDEVGRGAWAGPLLVCAARLTSPVEGLRDSKKLSARQREQLNSKILDAADIGYGWVSASDIDVLGLSASLKLATKQALEAICPADDEQIIIDGTVNFAPQYKSSITAVKADDSYPCVSAASIVAKVARDKYMKTLDDTFPEYKFGTHVGYGTRVHSEAIRMHGLCAEHRKSFRLPI